jgi:hypothetical protein
MGWGFILHPMASGASLKLLSIVKARGLEAII